MANRGKNRITEHESIDYDLWILLLTQSLAIGNISGGACHGFKGAKAS
jgi:hypothetical protein